ncbi:actin-like ATPase domain-containing protein [Ophiobolus disseminans]|uniref:Actin-like ATPase domain-containing protein n=1 Tax=Ophiobolus disseminans TaxID=1469910 RepID=A0A6A7ACT8_9PLEO|nr:actin-like ATPase domain-containing protein [Ophiobolus disseminans]
MHGNRLVIGLDYGTTYTGVSFCETTDTEAFGKNIEVIKDWPSAHTMIGTKEKVPSEIALHDNTKWGALISSNVPRHMWTKLELDTTQSGETVKIMKELSLDSRGPSRKPVDIIADYLTHVKDQLIKNLDRQFGKGVWGTLPITLVVTVPAVWSDSAKASTLEAVDKAGFNSTVFPKLKRTILTTEPEAAAIHTIQSLRGSVQDEQFAIGDGFIVCDMGGGTVDLVSYRIAELEPTTLEEATVGSGDQCGGSFVEQEFLKWLERRLGTEDFVAIAGARSEHLPRTSLPAKVSRMLQDFVFEAKSGFSGTEINFLRLPAPLNAIVDDELRGIVDGEIMITSEDMMEMFDFSLRRTYELLLQQLKQARRTGKVEIKYVFMVGGFSESPYMYEKIKAFTEDNGLQAIRPAYAWSAVVRGAAAKGLEGDGRAAIKNRKCRRHYGTECMPIFVPGKHRESDARICSYTGIKRADNQMRWLVNKGQDLATKADSHAKCAFVHFFWPGDARVSHMGLEACEFEKAPQRSKDAGIYNVATLIVDLTDVPQSAYTTCVSPTGRHYFQLCFEVEISVQSSLEYSLLVQGVRYGSVTAKYT